MSRLVVVDVPGQRSTGEQGPERHLHLLPPPSASLPSPPPPVPPARYRRRSRLALLGAAGLAGLGGLGALGSVLGAGGSPDSVEVQGLTGVAVGDPTDEAGPTASPTTTPSTTLATTVAPSTSRSTTTTIAPVTPDAAVPPGAAREADGSDAGSAAPATASTTGTAAPTTASTATSTSTMVAPTTTAPPPTTAATTTAPPTTVATTTAPTCDPNYSGCVPIASDVDCAGGSGNGPAYVAGPVRVIGNDIYDLDRDNDGIGCEDG